MFALQAAGKTPIQIEAWLSAARGRREMESPNLTAVRRALHGHSHKRSLPETRGAKRKLSKKQVRKLNTVRKTLLKKAGSESKVTYNQILRVGRLAQKDFQNNISQELQGRGLRCRVASGSRRANIGQEGTAGACQALCQVALPTFKLFHAQSRCYSGQQKVPDTHSCGSG